MHILGFLWFQKTSFVCNMCVNKMQNGFQTLIMLDISLHVSRKGGFLTVFVWILLFWAPTILWSLRKYQISMWNSGQRNWVNPANHNQIICKICLFQVSGHLYVNGWVIVCWLIQKHRQGFNLILPVRGNYQFNP